MATHHEDPPFYKNYSSDEAKKFESILRLIHGAHPNTELAKKMVLDFSGEDELARFRSFKSEFESALKAGSQNVKTHSSSLEKLNERRNDLVHQKTHIINQGVKRTSDELGNHTIKAQSPDKKPKR